MISYLLAHQHCQKHQQKQQQFLVPLSHHTPFQYQQHQQKLPHQQ